MARHSIYNVHTHIFNFDCVPSGFLTNYVPRAFAGILAKLLRKPGTAAIVRFLASKLVRKYATFVAVGTKKTPLEVYEEMIKSYDGEDAKFIILPMNFDYMGGGVAPANHLTQLELVLRVRAQYPDRCLPFLSIDPRQGSGKQILDFVKARIGPPKYQFVGIKLYPSLGFYPTDQRLELMYEYCEENEIPILTHCTREGAFYAGKKVPAHLLQYNSFNLTPATERRHDQPQYKNPSKKPSIACDNFLDPANYYDVLHKFENLKLCFAHFGGETEMRTVFNEQGVPSNQHPKLTTADCTNGFTEDTSWFRIIEYLMTEFKQTRADISFTLYDSKLFKSINNILLTEPYSDRVLFGTDYFMTTQHKKEFTLYDEFRNQLPVEGDNLQWQRISHINPQNYLRSRFFQPLN